MRIGLLSEQRHRNEINEGPKLEARRAEPGVGYLGRSAVSPLPTSLVVWGSAVSFSSGVRGEAPAAKSWCILGSSGELSCSPAIIPAWESFTPAWVINYPGNVLLPDRYPDNKVFNLI